MPRSVVTAGYPFFQYALNQWVFHTTTFRSQNTTTWDLWKYMVQTELTLWLESNWEPKAFLDQNDNWLPLGEQSDLQHNREQLVLCHKAILLAQFTGHRALLGQLFLVLQQQHAILSRRLLKALMTPKQIIIGTVSPISLTFTDADIHTNVISIIAQYVAFGGRLEMADMIDREKCSLNSAQEHSNGISHDICVMLCAGRPIPANNKWMQLSAQVSFSELDDELFNHITYTLMNSHLLYEARTVQKKTIVNLLIERDVDWWLKISDWISNNLKNWSTVNTLMRDSLKCALRSQDEHSVDLLIREKHVDWTDKGTMDHELIRYAIQFKNMNRGLRQQLIDSVIGSRSSAQITFEIQKREDERKEEEKGLSESQKQLSAGSVDYVVDFSDSTDSLDSIFSRGDPLYYHPSAFPEPVDVQEHPATEFEKEMILYGRSILEAVNRSDWDIAVALYKHDSGLIAAGKSEQRNLQIISKVLKCITQQGEFSPSCYVTEAA
ncbi:hypothetical protein CKAH01_05693 [Colletotrichum kahawae]|uniref:Uncharacterized protein n=1 Tax=Colletotrichum kahawae TaxID=34407 RepID=A0AAD9YEP5_COLKA|nr:hypothetical protein CKAH01_05693 [Colletotrichum kahawae]